jgi:hypothetical protein
VTLYCGSTLFGSNHSMPSLFDSYPGSARDESGPEVVYRFESPIKGTASITLTPAGGDLDLIALDADPKTRGCIPEKPLKSSLNVGAGVETVQLDVEQGATYYLVVDGPGGSTASYRIEASCQKQQ